MKVLASVMLCLMVLCCIIIPGIGEYNKHKGEPKKEMIVHTLTPLLCFLGLILGIILYGVLFIFIYKLFKNLFVAFLLSLAIGVPIINYFGNK